MKLKDIIATPDMRKPSSGLMDANKAIHLATKRLHEQKLAKEAPKREAPKAEAKKAEEEKKAVEHVKRFSVNDFVSAHLH